MKKLLILFAALVMLFACENQDAGNATVVPPLDLTAFQVRDIPGTDLQKAERFNQEGRVMEEGILKNGKRNGAWIVYNETKDVPGKIASFADDVFHGPYLEYNEFGQLELMCSYSNNLLDGQFVRYGSSRKLESGFYKNGKLDGLHKKYFQNKDAVQQESVYREGVLHGTMRYFNEAGEVVMEYEYQNGEKMKGGIVEHTTATE